MSEELTDQEQQRRLKLERLYEAGIDPYPARAERTHTAAQAAAALASAGEAPSLWSQSPVAWPASG